MEITFRKGDFADRRILDLLDRHLRHARAETAPGSAHALDLSGLQDESVSFWSAWLGEELVGVGAMKRLSEDHYEVKSMHTVEKHRGRGIGSRILQHIERCAKERGVRRLSLETGSWDYFKPAVALYARNGYALCAPFADYVEDPNSIFMTKDIAQAEI